MEQGGSQLRYTQMTYRTKYRAKPSLPLNRRETSEESHTLRPNAF